MSDLQTLADLVRKRNMVVSALETQIKDRATAQRLGIVIAATVFRIRRNEDSESPRFDGRFEQGEFAGRSVDVHWFTQERCLAIHPNSVPDFYLIFLAPKASDECRTPAWWISSAHFFDSKTFIPQLLREYNLHDDVSAALNLDAVLSWDESEIFPRSQCSLFSISEQQRSMLSKFSEPIQN